MSDTNKIAYITDGFIVQQATRPIKKKLKFGHVVQLRFYWCRETAAENCEKCILVLNSNVLAADSKFDGFLGCVLAGSYGLAPGVGYVGTFPNACVERILNAEDAVNTLDTEAVSDDDITFRFQLWEKNAQEQLCQRVANELHLSFGWQMRNILT